MKAVMDRAGGEMRRRGKLYTAIDDTNRPGHVSVLDPQTGRALKRIARVAGLTRLATEPSQRFMYLVNCGGNKIQVIDLAVDAVVGEMHGGALPAEIAFLPKRASGLQR